MEWFVKSFLVWLVKFTGEVVAIEERACGLSSTTATKRDKSKFSWIALLFKHFFIKIHPNMSEQEKKRQRIHDLVKAETKQKKFRNNWKFFHGLHQARP